MTEICTLISVFDLLLTRLITECTHRIILSFWLNFLFSVCWFLSRLWFFAPPCLLLSFCFQSLNHSIPKHRFHLISYLLSVQDSKIHSNPNAWFLQEMRSILLSSAFSFQALCSSATSLLIWDSLELNLHPLLFVGKNWVFSLSLLPSNMPIRYRVSLCLVACRHWIILSRTADSLRWTARLISYHPTQVRYWFWTFARNRLRYSPWSHFCKMYLSIFHTIH